MTEKKKSFSLRRLFFWSHLICGLTAGLVILLLCVTGTLLAFEHPILAYFDRQQLGEIHPQSTRIPISELTAKVEKMAHQPVSSITLSAAPDDPLTFEAGRNRNYVADPWSGQIKAASPRMHDFFHTIVTVHRWFALADASHETVEQITGWSTLAFVFIILSGIYLWLPPMWKRAQFRVRLRPGWSSNPRARDWNWHNAFGFWLAIPLLCIAVSGVVMALPWSNALLFRLTGSPLPKMHRGQGGPEREARSGAHVQGAHGARPQGASPRAEGALQAAEHVEQNTATAAVTAEQLFAAASLQSNNWKSLQLRMPSQESKEYNVVLDRGNGYQPQLRDTLIFSANGSLLRRENFTQQSMGSRVRQLLRYLHTGELFGSFGRSLAMLASLAGCLLVWTGFALSWRRFFPRSVRT